MHKTFPWENVRKVERIRAYQKDKRSGRLRQDGCIDGLKGTFQRSTVHRPAIDEQHQHGLFTAVVSTRHIALQRSRDNPSLFFGVHLSSSPELVYVGATMSHTALQ
jgi:hypothetical protein